MGDKVSLRRAEEILSKLFKGKWCSFTYPGYPTVYGIVDEIAVDIPKLPEQDIIIQMNNKVYSVSIECLHECLKILRSGNT